ncbi:MAG: Gfo/Idh/MocA family oxidoreductase, partial [Gemmatimonadetes bacterium]|nr:Gfo/Idh/MocA family oxidoreductase [Gemmatimonadota bacterium]
MDKVRIGIIGLGGMGSNHAGYIYRGEIPGAEIAAVADADPARLEGAKEKFGEGVQVFEGADA